MASAKTPPLPDDLDDMRPCSTCYPPRPSAYCRHCGGVIVKESNDVDTWWVHEKTGARRCWSPLAEPMGA